MNQQPSYYAILTADIRYDKQLSAHAKLLFAEITALSQKEGFAWASNSYFAELYSVDKDTVSRWVSELVKSKYIKISVDKKAGNVRKIYIEAIRKNADPIRKKDYSYTQKDHYPIRKNADIILQENIKENKSVEKESKTAPGSRGQYSPAKEKLMEQVRELANKKQV